MKICIIGLGALGSILVKKLKGFKIEKMVVVDDDKVERHNMNSSVLFEIDSVGRFKVAVAEEYLIGKKITIEVLKFKE